MVLLIVFYEVVDFPTFIYALYRTPIQAFSGIPTRDESETPSPEPSGAVFAGKLTTCYEHSSVVACLHIIMSHMRIVFYFIACHLSTVRHEISWLCFHSCNTINPCSLD